MPQEIEAVIFDMDGVILDSEPLHLESANLILGEEGHVLSEDENRPYLGWNETRYWTDLIRRFGLRQPLETLIRRRHASLVALLEERLPVDPGIEGVMEAFAARGLPMAVASGSDRALIDLVLDRSGLRRFIAAIAAGDEVGRPKPDPEVFLLAAARLGRKPASCLVFEDSPNGVRAALAAGMAVVRVITGMTRSLSFPAVDQEIEGFSELDVEPLLGGRRSRT